MTKEEAAGATLELEEALESDCEDANTRKKLYEAGKEKKNGMKEQWNTSKRARYLASGLGEKVNVGCNSSTQQQPTKKREKLGKFGNSEQQHCRPGCNGGEVVVTSGIGAAGRR
ncbi:hypothetical protein CDL15_Pgr023765 [Punica granatum]|uniref:Uncharacterized protein n=1 Tax=Punica granatum TaxID=22663 RepID=A0A218WQW5_PUNGR|nr:hypothetical protein CDL15_Pgr023765 [Punica granatum]